MHDHRFLRDRFFIRLLGKIPVVAHQAEDNVASAHAGFEPQVRRKAGRRFQNPGKHGSLRYGQVAGVYAEVPACCRFDPVVAAAEIDKIQIHLQDLVLAVPGLELIG